MPDFDRNTAFALFNQKATVRSERLPSVECNLLTQSSSQEPQAEYPVAWLPNVRTKALKTFLAESGANELRDVPDDLLNDVQWRVKAHTLAGEAYFDATGAKADLTGSGWPAYFMDFETINLVVRCTGFGEHLISGRCPAG